MNCMPGLPSELPQHEPLCNLDSISQPAASKKWRHRATLALFRRWMNVWRGRENKSPPCSLLIIFNHNATHIHAWEDNLLTVFAGPFLLESFLLFHIISMARALYPSDVAVFFLWWQAKNSLPVWTCALLASWVALQPCFLSSDRIELWSAVGEAALSLCGQSPTRIAC